MKAKQRLESQQYLNFMIFSAASLQLAKPRSCNTFQVEKNKRIKLKFPSFVQTRVPQPQKKSFKLIFAQNQPCFALALFSIGTSIAQHQHCLKSALFCIAQHQHFLALAFLSISIAYHQHCLELALLSIGIAQHWHWLALALISFGMALHFF